MDQNFPSSSFCNKRESWDTWFRPLMLLFCYGVNILKFEQFEAQYIIVWANLWRFRLNQHSDLYKKSFGGIVNGKHWCFGFLGSLLHCCQLLVCVGTKRCDCLVPLWLVPVLCSQLMNFVAAAAVQRFDLVWYLFSKNYMTWFKKMQL